MRQIIVILIAVLTLGACEHTKGGGLSPNERAFHLEHGAGAYTPRGGYGRHHWRQ